MTKSSPVEIRKRLDTSLPADVLSRSNVTIYWLQERFRQMWKEFRPGFSRVLPKAYDPYDQDEIIRKFQLKGIEYGNWLNQEDRYNYFLALQIALFDLQHIVRFGYNIGLNRTIGIAFGARGKSGALGHFEPDTFMINLTRFKEAKKLKNPFTGQPVFGKKTTSEVKEILFSKTGGVGSLGHEYAHALDYFFGTYIEQDTRYREYRSLTQGRSVSTSPDTNYRRDSLRYDANMIIHKLIWNADKTKTAYYKVIEEGINDGSITEYWARHCELFARAFEVYLNHKLNEKGIRNDFLTHKKYEGKWQYPQGNTLKAVIPHFDSLITKMRNKL